MRGIGLFFHKTSPFFIILISPISLTAGRIRAVWVYVSTPATPLLRATTYAPRRHAMPPSRSSTASSASNTFVVCTSTMLCDLSAATSTATPQWARARLASSALSISQAILVLTIFHLSSRPQTRSAGHRRLHS